MKLFKLYSSFVMKVWRLSFGAGWGSGNEFTLFKLDLIHPTDYGFYIFELQVLKFVITLSWDPKE